MIPHFDILINARNDLYINIVKSLINQTLKDLEILLSIKNINTTFFYKIYQNYKKYKNIKIFEGEKELFNDTIQLIELLEK